MSNESIVIAVDMGEGGPMSEIDRVESEARQAIISALVYHSLFRNFAIRDRMRFTEVDERGDDRRVTP